MTNSEHTTIDRTRSVVVDYLATDLIDWYLEQREDIASEEQLLREHAVIRKVIHRLVTKDKILIRIDVEQENGTKKKKNNKKKNAGEDEQEKEKEEEEEEEETDELLAVHPNVPRDFALRG